MVEFIVIKAKGKLQFPETIWGEQEFDAAYDKIDGFAKAIEADLDKFKMSGLALALSKQPAKVLASLGWPALDSPGYQNYLLQSDRGSHQSIDEEPRPEHPSPPEK